MSVLAAPDHRPILVSILGGAWILMGFFGMIQGVFIATGLNEGLSFSSATVDQEAMDDLAVYDDPTAIEARAQRERYQTLNRSFGLPWIGVSLLAGIGGLRLVRRNKWSRSVILAGGIGAVALAVWHAYLGLQITLDVEGAELLMPDERRLFYLTAGAGAMLNAIPAVVGVLLLRHKLVRDWVSNGL